jgi:hypothetical protein
MGQKQSLKRNSKNFKIFTKEKKQKRRQKVAGLKKIRSGSSKIKIIVGIKRIVRTRRRSYKNSKSLLIKKSQGGRKIIVGTKKKRF